MKTKRKKTRPYLGILSIHSAPYRDPVFALINKRQVIDIKVLTMFYTDKGHPYRDLDKLDYPNIFLDNCYCIRNNICWHSQIISILRKEKFDAVIVSGYNHITSLVAIIYCKITHTPLIFSSDSILDKNSSKNHFPVRNWLRRKILKYSKTFWVPGKASRLCLQHYNIPDSNIFEGCYCLDIDYLNELNIKAKALRGATRKKLDLDKNDFIFLFVGRMIPSRGLQILANAFFQLNQIVKNIALLLIGNGPEKKWIESFIKEKKLLKVRFIDGMPFKDLATYYSVADAYVLPAINEPYSLAVAQAAISSIPIIATKQVGAVSDYVIDGKTGYIVPVGNSHVLVKTMHRLSSNQSMAKKMGHFAHKLALERNVKWATMQLEDAVIKAVNINYKNY